jgi:hypothetical protein
MFYIAAINITRKLFFVKPASWHYEVESISLPVILKVIFE